MILTPPIVARLIALGVLTVVIQVSTFAQVTPLGSSPDVALLVVMSLGLLGGALAGGVAGFAIGFGIDSIAFQLLGSTSLALIAVGYVAGRYREGFGRPTNGAIALIGGALTLLGTAAFGAVQIGTGVDANVSSKVVLDAFSKSVLGALLALPVFMAVRLALRPALIDDRPVRRRRRRRRDEGTEPATVT